MGLFSKIFRSLLVDPQKDSFIQGRRGIEIKTSREINLISKAGKIVSSVFEELEKNIGSEMSTYDLDKYIDSLVREYGGLPSYKGYSGYQFSSTISINNEVENGLPNKDKFIKEGDLIKIGLGVCYKGFHANKGIILPLGRLSPNVLNLISVNREVLAEGIKMVKPGNSIFDMAGVIEDIVLSYGFSVVEEYTGSGIGRSLHEEPSIFNFRTSEIPNTIFREGMTFTVNPIINEGTKYCVTQKDGISMATKDGLLSSSLRDTVVVTRLGAKVLT